MIAMCAIWCTGLRYFIHVDTVRSFVKKSQRTRRSATFAKKTDTLARRARCNNVIPEKRRCALWIIKRVNTLFDVTKKNGRKQQFLKVRDRLPDGGVKHEGGKLARARAFPRGELVRRDAVARSALIRSEVLERKREGSREATCSLAATSRSRLSGRSELINLFFVPFSIYLFILSSKYRPSGREHSKHLSFSPSFRTFARPLRSFLVATADSRSRRSCDPEDEEIERRERKRKAAKCRRTRAERVNLERSRRPDDAAISRLEHTGEPLRDTFSRNQHHSHSVRNY